MCLACALCLAFDSPVPGLSGLPGLCLLGLCPCALVPCVCFYVRQPRGRVLSCAWFVLGLCLACALFKGLVLSCALFDSPVLGLRACRVLLKGGLGLCSTAPEACLRGLWPGLRAGLCSTAPVPCSTAPGACALPSSPVPCLRACAAYVRQPRACFKGLHSSPVPV